MDIGGLRSDYAQARLDESSALDDPVAQLQAWLGDAVARGVPEPNAMTLATVGQNGAPSARVVLLRGLDEGGLVFFTNRGSRKGEELAVQPKAALVFFWPQLERQVRAEGLVELVSDPESDAYFASRPRASQIAAHASPQSRVIPNREELERLVVEAEGRFPGDVSRPSDWGGYRMIPTVIEFWQGRESRLHDRLRYRKIDRGWVIERLAP